MRICRSLFTAILLTLALLVPALAYDQPAAAPSASAVKAELIDINAATEAQLKSLPGIGDAYAAKIIAGRPYTRKDQLKSRNIVPAATYEKIQDRIIARQPGN
jgi:DNA uptake protein ComE-like DNA-binding protein